MINYGYTELHIACLEGNIKDVKKFLSTIDVNSKSIDGNTPLIMTTVQNINKHKNRYSIIKLLLDSGADMYAENSKAITFMQGCIVQGDYKSIEYALVKRNFDVHKKTIMGETPILSAAYSKARHNTKMFDFLVEKAGSNLHDVDIDGNNCLHVACEQPGNIRMIKHLLKKYSEYFSLEDKNKYGQTPVQLITRLW